jgi:hypothetical protein
LNDKEYSHKEHDVAHEVGCLEQILHGFRMDRISCL